MLGVFLTGSDTSSNTLFGPLQATTAKVSGLDPVLTVFRDQVLYLKHNLNAQAVASLKGEATNIQNDIARLIEQMNASIARADEFVKTLK